MVARNPRLAAKHLIRDDNVSSVTVTSNTPAACQIDGDYIGSARNHDVHVGPRGAERRRPDEEN